MVDFSSLWYLGITVGFYQVVAVEVLLGCHQSVLGTGYAFFNQSGLVDFLVQVHFLDDSLDQTFTVGSIINSEVSAETDAFVLVMEDTKEDGVEGAHPQVLSSFHTYLLGYALFHLSCSLVGESKGENVPRVVFLLLKQIGYFVGQYACLARSGTSYDQ